VQNAAETRIESSKRRSTRIAQAVPLVVTGVDALGRPFQERTSTQAINCHGGRYQSKHYVLKNMWVTLEVPHPQSGLPPRRLRGRVTWIQRPRTVRELFQVAVELEVTGNIWGIAFPPPDWTPFNEDAVAQILSAELLTEPETEARTEETQAPAEELDNLRVLPSPGTDPSVMLARQMARLVVEARQQIQAAVREATTRAVAEETRPLLAAVESQLRETAQHAAHRALAEQANQQIRQSQEEMAQASREFLESLREQWDRESEKRMDVAGHEFLARAGKIKQSHLETFEQQLDTRLRESLARIQELSGEISTGTERAESVLSRLNQELDQSAGAASKRIELLIEAKAREVFTHLSDLDQAAQRTKSEVEAAAAAAHEAWRARLESYSEATAATWQNSIARSLEDAAQRTAKRLSQQTEAAAQQFDQELALRLAAQRRSFEEVARQAQNALAELRETLDRESVRSQEVLAQIQDSASRLENQAASLDAMSRTTAEELQERFESILTTESAELNRRAEVAVTGMAERLQPIIEAAGEETLSRLAGQMEAQLTPHVDRAKELVVTLSAETSAAEQMLREHEDRIRQRSEQSAREAAAQLQEMLGRFERDFEEAARVAKERWLADLESKATETSHTTFEALLKASTWYEKKVQTQMQATIEKGTEQAEEHLRKKAGEFSALFASELDHYSRSYIEHSEGELGEALTESLQKAREQMGAVAGEVASSFQEDIRARGQEKYEQFTREVGGAVEQFSAGVEAIGEDTLSRIGAEATRSFADFEENMGRQLQQGATQVRRDLEAQLAPLIETWKKQRSAQERQFEMSVRQIEDRSLESYKERLENASNSFLVTAVAGLSKQTQGLVENVAHTAEDRLRNVAGEVFTGIGETLRLRLLELSASFSSPSSSHDTPANP
jgi:hypothetical protein